MAIARPSFRLIVAALAAAALGAPPTTAAVTVTRDGWEISLTPYVWATALNGDVAVGGAKAKVDADFNDVLDCPTSAPVGQLK